MQNLTLTGWSPFRCMCLWYKKQSKYSVQIFFVTLNEKYLLTQPRSPNTEYQKPKVIYCRALLYTQTLWHRATRASICLCTFRISLNTHQTPQVCPSSYSPITWTPGSSSQSSPLVLSLSHTLTQPYGDTHTYIHTQGTMNRTLIKH